MWNILNEIEGIRQNILSKVSNEIQSVLGNINFGVTQNVIKPISNDVTNVLDQIGNSVNYIAQSAYNGIRNTISEVGTGLQTLEQKTVAGFWKGLAVVSDTLQTLSRDIEKDFNAIVLGIHSGFTAMHNGIVTAFTVVANNVEAGIKYLSIKLTEGIKDVIDPLIAFIEKLPKDIETIALGVEKNIEKLADTIHDGMLKWAENLAKMELSAGEELEKVLKGHATMAQIEEYRPHVEKTLSSLIGIDLGKINKGMFARLVASLGVEIAISSLAESDEGLAYMLGQQLPALLQVALKSSWRDLEQASNAEIPNVLIGVGEAIGARYKGYVSDDYFYDQVERAGISHDNADILYKTANTLLGLGELIALFFRGNISSLDDLYKQAGQVRADTYQVDQSINLFMKLFGAGESIEIWRRDILPDNFVDFFDDLRKNGYNEARIDAIKKSSYKLATLDQQKKFNYRKIYDTASVEKYQYDYMLDDRYLSLAKKNGFDEETAKEIYRGSWEPAPFFITEGLFSRGKISEKTFTELLLLDGYTPYWAKKFIQEMQPTLALGDIKDLYKYQVISADEIVSQVMGIGFSKELAEQYKQLWIASVKLASPLEQTDTQVEAKTIKGKTEGLIRQAYKDKIINKDQALSDFKDINVSTEAAQLYIDIIDYEIKQENISSLYVLVEDELKAKSITMTHAINKLQEAGATADQIMLYTVKLDKATSRKVKTPTLAEFASWYKKGIITAEMLKEAISMLGYPDVWIPFFLLEYKVPTKVVTKLFGKTRHPLIP